MKKASKNIPKTIPQMVNEVESEILEIMKDNGEYARNLIFFRLKKLGLNIGHDYSNKLIKKLDLEKKYNIAPDTEAELTDLLNARDIKAKEE